MPDKKLLNSNLPYVGRGLVDKATLTVPAHIESALIPMRAKSQKTPSVIFLSDKDTWGH